MNAWCGCRRRWVRAFACVEAQALGFDVTLVEKLDKPGGRAYVREADGFRFGPTVITVPHIEELFELRRDENHLDRPDFEDIADPANRITVG